MRSVWLAGLLAALSLLGCSQAAQLVKETDRGGIVTYIYKPERGGASMSPHRAEALKLIGKKCPGGYAVVREGEARMDQSVRGVLEGTEDDAWHRWGLEFKCRQP